MAKLVLLKTLNPSNEKTPVRLRVLLADDNREMRETIADLLDPEFEIVGAVCDGFAFLEAARELKPDIAILDISMPVMNGLEAAIEIRKSFATISIVFLSVHEDPDFEKAAFESGANGYVAKRHMASDLKIAVRKAVEWRPK